MPALEDVIGFYRVLIGRRTGYNEISYSHFSFKGHFKFIGLAVDFVVLSLGFSAVLIG